MPCQPFTIIAAAVKPRARCRAAEVAPLLVAMAMATAVAESMATVVAGQTTGVAGLLVAKIKAEATEAAAELAVVATRRATGHSRAAKEEYY